ncbi:unnamed protein product [Cladocopium goreaui]|uniref:Cystatin-B n=1 Tax=Cladocopium goreaui TaxID=2562237 RepID=A0A9P1FNU6_9DINO|nr:unnamed protein product [Cladocopium goreaui]
MAGMTGMTLMLRFLLLSLFQNASAVGGPGEIKAATQETQKLLAPLRTKVCHQAQEAGYTSEFTKFAAISERLQVVAGRNHFVKVQVAPESYIHVRIFESLPHMKKDPELVAIELDHTYDSAIDIFPAAKEL